MTSDAREAATAGGLPPGVSLHAPPLDLDATVLTRTALSLMADLEREHRARRAELLQMRVKRQERYDAGDLPDFLEETRSVRTGDWRVAPCPSDLRDRRVEITGPVDRKMVINALNSGARVFMADFEDSCSPTWEKLIQGQQNLMDAIRRRIDFEHPETHKQYTLTDEPATLVVRPRGWHLGERHVQVDGQPVSASIFDFALFLAHNAHELLSRGSGPYFYLPKLESHLEARLWNDIFVSAQRALGLTIGTIKATVLIETLPAAFEMDEILYELRDHSVGLNCGRWDYIFSFIKTTRKLPEFVLPDRASIGMDRHFLASYSQLLIQTCHRRGAHGIGGMAAQIPIRGNFEANEAAMEKVRKDKQREVQNGHDGTWVAHPALVDLARAEFDLQMEGPHQIGKAQSNKTISRADLLCAPQGEITLAGLRHNLSVGIRYMAAWLCGNGCVPIDNLMEDAATAEISRTQLWQWRHHGAETTDGILVDADLLRDELTRTLDELRTRLGDIAFTRNRMALAGELFAGQIMARDLPAFLTLEAYEHLTN